MIDFFEKMQRICAKYDLELDEEVYKYKFVEMQKTRAEYGNSEKELEKYREMVLQHGISLNLKLAKKDNLYEYKNNESTEVPEWLQEEINFVYDYNKKIIVAKYLYNIFDSLELEGDVGEKHNNSLDFFKKVLSPSVFEEYKMKLLFQPKEAASFIRDKKDEVMEEIVKRLNETKQYEKMTDEIYKIVEKI